MAFFEDRTLAHGELATAFATLPKTMAHLAFRVLLTGLCADAFKAIRAIYATAMGAHWAVSPQYAFNMRKGCGFVVHVWLAENGHFLPLSS